LEIETWGGFPWSSRDLFLGWLPDIHMVNALALVENDSGFERARYMVIYRFRSFGQLSMPFIGVDLCL